MKERIIIIVAVILIMPLGLFGQTYNELWKLVKQAQSRDLPQTAVTHIEKIERKARQEKAYGQLLKSVLVHAQLVAEVSPDSLTPAVSRLEQQEQEAARHNPVLQAVYDAVLSQIYERNPQLSEQWRELSETFRAKALSRPDLLAQTKADGYVPFVIQEKHSEMYDEDLLSVVGTELNAWKVLSDYYQQSGNRRAACYTSLRRLMAEQEPAGHEPYARSAYLKSLDSLIEVYGDLPEACEVAMQAYRYMREHTDAPLPEIVARLQAALDRWPTWPRANLLRLEWMEMINPTFRAEVPNSVVEVGVPQTVQLSMLRHLQTLTMRVYRTRQKGDTQLKPDNPEDYKQLRGELEELTDQRRTITFSGHEDYEEFQDSIQIGGLPAGVYMLELETTPSTRVSRMLYFVSGLRLITQPQPGNAIRYVVVDATTGQPVGGTTVRLAFSNGWRKPRTYKKLTADSQGEVVYGVENHKQPNSVYVYNQNDSYCPESNSYGRYSYYEHQYNQVHTNLFTDRSIYRPGQTVSVAAIVWKELSALENQAVANHQVRMELRDANYKIVGEQTATTDHYGKCSVQFTLPQGLLNGRFTIRAVDGGSTSIRVEEYKRPTFQVEFPAYEQSYQQGDTVRAEGRAMSYAGVPVQGGRVKYTVCRKVAFWWMQYSWYWEMGSMGSGQSEEVVYEGESVTADDGTFQVSMPLVVPKRMNNHPMFYQFVVEADVTDEAGETHGGTMSLPLGTKPTALTCNLPRQVRSDQLPSVTFTRCNAAGMSINGIVKYRIDGGKWLQCEANHPQQITQRLKSGEHRLEAVCESDEVDMTFVVFGLDDKKPAITTDDWFYVSASQFPDDGSPVVVQVGSSDSDLHIVYSVFSGEKMLESGRVEKNAELINRKLKYEERYGNGLLLTFAWVKNGRCHIHQHTISRPLPPKQLTLMWQTFRDRLTPGQHEEWQLKIKKPDGTPADASLLAVLYDKSLDQIHPHQWSFMPALSFSQPYTGWQWNTPGGASLYGRHTYKSLSVPSWDFSHFDSSVFPSMTVRRLMVRGTRVMKAAALQDKMAVAASADAAIGAFDVAGNDEAAGEALKAKNVVAVGYATQEENGKSQSAHDDVPLRENLQETAFCYPSLESDSLGQITLKFILPESLTTWRFMGVANTSQMLYGTISGEAVAKKDVMVQPNMPRFLRMGDAATLSARIFNTSEKLVSGTARLTLTDPETNRIVYQQELPFSVEAGQGSSVSFQFQPADDYSLLICRVTAVGEGFSDGEQHYLPILPNREYVTKTVPYTQHEPGEKTIDLTQLFPAGTTQQKLTVEYTSNPAWLMVQSLSEVGQPWEHSAIDQAASYYSNALALWILKQNPQAQIVFEQWKRESGEETTLQSQLQKDQELKDLVLSETPWVWAADREAEQKQRLADFFDQNGISHRLSTAVGKLQKMQHADGSFSWYPGMQGSTMVTVAVEEMLARLHVMAGTQDAVRDMQTKAFNYIGREMVDVVKELKRQEQKGQKPSFPSFTALRWLYICAIDGRELSTAVRQANDYLVRLLKKDTRHQTIYEKALTAVVLAKRGENKLAKQYVQSLKEYTVFTEEMGRYYDTPRASYSWYDYKIPTEVAAIEAIQTVTPADRKTLDEMRRWLLQEKRTQVWDTPINSVNAIYAFLHDNSQVLTASGQQQTVLAIDGQPLDLPKATAGLGYVKKAIAQPQGRIFTASKTTEGTAWGAVYAQFFQNTSDVEAAQSGIAVRRELFAANGQPQTGGSLRVGSRVKVRITIESSRDLDFVQVVDRRAACMEPVRQLSGYQHGAYVSPKDNATHYFYYGMSKGKHAIETDYYIDRAGQYETGTCTAGCAYAPEYRSTAPSLKLNVQ